MTTKGTTVLMKFFSTPDEILWIFKDNQKSFIKFLLIG